MRQRSRSRDKPRRVINSSEQRSPQASPRNKRAVNQRLNSKFQDHSQPVQFRQPSKQKRQWKPKQFYKNQKPMSSRRYDEEFHRNFDDKHFENSKVHSETQQSQQNKVPIKGNLKANWRPNPYLHSNSGNGNNYHQYNDNNYEGYSNYSSHKSDYSSHKHDFRRVNGRQYDNQKYSKQRQTERQRQREDQKRFKPYHQQIFNSTIRTFPNENSTHTIRGNIQYPTNFGQLPIQKYLDHKDRQKERQKKEKQRKRKRQSSSESSSSSSSSPSRSQKKRKRKNKKNKVNNSSSSSSRSSSSSSSSFRSSKKHKRKSEPKSHKKSYKQKNQSQLGVFKKPYLQPNPYQPVLHTENVSKSHKDYRYNNQYQNQKYKKNFQEQLLPSRYSHNSVHGVPFQKFEKPYQKPFSKQASQNMSHSYQKGPKNDTFYQKNQYISTNHRHEYNSKPMGYQNQDNKQGFYNRSFRNSGFHYNRFNQNIESEKFNQQFRKPQQQEIHVNRFTNPNINYQQNQFPRSYYNSKYTQQRHLGRDRGPYQNIQQENNLISTPIDRGHSYKQKLNESFQQNQSKEEINYPNQNANVSLNPNAFDKKLPETKSLQQNQDYDKWNTQTQQVKSFKQNFFESGYNNRIQKHSSDSRQYRQNYSNQYNRQRKQIRNQIRDTPTKMQIEPYSRQASQLQSSSYGRSNYMQAVNTYSQFNQQGPQFKRYNSSAALAESQMDLETQINIFKGQITPEEPPGQYEKLIAQAKKNLQFDLPQSNFLILDAFRSMPRFQSQTIDPVWLQKLNEDIQKIDQLRQQTMQNINFDLQKPQQTVFMFSKKQVSQKELQFRRSMEEIKQHSSLIMDTFFKLSLESMIDC